MHYNPPKHAYVNGKRVPYKSDEYRQYQKKLREKRIANGRCHCGKQARPDHKKCQPCVDYATSWKRRKLSIASWDAHWESLFA